MRVQIDRLVHTDMNELHLNPVEQGIMHDCVKLSDVTWVGRIDGEMVCMWGLVPPTLLSKQAYLWMYNTEAIHEHPFVFVRHSQRVIEVMLRDYDRIVGHAMAGETNSIRWLKWLGAKFGEPNGRMIPFKIERKHG